MGTHRSRHNKGRKPLYKEHGADTVRHWQEPVAFAPHTPQIQQPIRRRPNASKPVELIPMVAAFLEKRKEKRAEERAQETAVAKINAPYSAAELFRTIEGEAFVSPDIVRASDRDVLMQLFVEKKISAQQLRAGRVWQNDMEAATIQPSTTIDWSEPRSGVHYQPRGTITERQYSAMKRRQAFQQAMGVSLLRGLDFCLNADRGRDELTRDLARYVGSVDRLIKSLLDTLASAAGIENRSASAWAALTVEKSSSTRPHELPDSAARRVSEITPRRHRRPVIVERSRTSGTTKFSAIGRSA